MRAIVQLLRDDGEVFADLPSPILSGIRVFRVCVLPLFMKV